MNQITIGQLAKKAGVKVETVRHYERRNLISEPPRSDSGYRQYRSKDVQRIRFIKRAQRLGFTLREIEELLQLRVDPDTTCADVKTEAEAKIEDIRQRIRSLQKMKRVLTELTVSCDSRAPTNNCPILESLAKVDFIYDDDCPNVTAARQNLERAFERTGRKPVWREWRRAESSEDFQHYGSPTILVDGVDVGANGAVKAGESCRLYHDNAGNLSGVPSVESIASKLQSDEGHSLQPRDRWSRMWAVAPAIATSLLPKLTCPACWPAYAGVLSTLGLGFVDYTPYLMPLTIAFLLIALGSLGRSAYREGDYKPLFLGILGALFVLVGKFELDMEAAMYGGIALLMAAFVWTSWPKQNHDCAQHASQT